jgi:hypothetical protein
MIIGAGLAVMILFLPNRGFPPEPGGYFNASQQPGSPACPQQLCFFLNLMKLLRNNK